VGFADEDYEDDPWSVPIIDLDAALGPFQTPASPGQGSATKKSWLATSHRRTESAPEIRGLGLDQFELSEDLAFARGIKRKMSVIDEEDKPPPPARVEELVSLPELDRMLRQEGSEIGEMGDLVVTPAQDKRVAGKLSKRRSWRKSIREWWKRV
jgi:hypothetical protein